MLRNVFFEPCMEGLQTGLRNILFRATTGGLLEIEGNGRERECSFTYHNRPHTIGCKLRPFYPGKGLPPPSPFRLYGQFLPGSPRDIYREVKNGWYVVG